MRIGIDIGKADGPRDGISAYVRHLVRALLALAGDDELVLYPLFGELPETAVAATFGELPPNARLAASASPAPGEIDVFHVTTHTLPTAIAAPIVYTLYDLTFLNHAAYHTVANRLHCLAGLVGGCRRGARWIAISEAGRAAAIAELGLAPETIRAIPLAPACAPAPVDAAALVRRELETSPPYLLFVGTVEPRKNLDRLFAAFSGLAPARRRSTPLLVAGGRGWLSEPIVARAEPLVAEGSVRFLGEVADDLLPALYAAAQALLYPSLAEGFGLPVIEAMACGTPVLTSRDPALAELAGEAALLVDPLSVDEIRSGIERLLDDADLRVRLRERGRARAAGYSWERTARRTLDAYAEAVAAP